MPTTIKLKNSVTTTNAPSSLVQGEVAINITDKKVWVGNAATTPVQLLGDGGSASFTSIAFGAGTVSLPSITFIGDTNTGIYSPAADTIAFTEGGVEAMRIDSSGNVGIGTSSPTFTAGGGLQISNATQANLRLSDTTNAAYNFDLFMNDADAYAVNRTSGPIVFGTNNTERMRIDSSGNVGIGASPGTILDVYKSSGNPYFRVYTGTGSVQGYMQALDSTYVKMGSLSNHDLGLTTNGTERMRIDTSGNVQVGTTTSAGKVRFYQTADAPTLTLTSDQSGYLSSSQAVLNIVTTNGTSNPTTSFAISTAYNGNTLFNVRNDGNVGIGTSSPGDRLVVRGAASVYGDERRLAQLVDTTALASGVGAGIAFYGVSESGGGVSQFGSIKGIKENATSANYAGALAFVTSNSSNVQTERMRITSAGDVGIGNTAPGAKLEVTGAIRSLRTGSTAAILQVINDNNSWNISSGTSTAQFRIDNNLLGTALTINGNSNIVLAGGTATASGVGITFPATQSASSDANCLDDYEEGTWTPTVKGTSTAGTGTYGAQNGFYTKIGNRILFQCYVQWSNLTGAAGFLALGGLPFTSNSSSGSYAALSTWNSNIALTANNVLLAYVNPNSSDITLVQYPVGGGSDTNIAIDTAGSIMVAGHYFV